ncbi:MAG TPA: hypothetical protein PKJ16_09845 [Spirochaetota bacterium]|nr:hypothetical protein [Spirochaetota bacterium]HOS40344.1 hypothetical protein [Spirochaetota bacterium]HPU88718.1 hypothetical protein [Spirochaetota bacterium]
MKDILIVHGGTMKALRFVERIANGRIVVAKLDKYSGMDAEVIIIPLIETKSNGKNATTKKTASMRGCLKKYANPLLVQDEKEAWATAAGKKHAGL